MPERPPPPNDLWPDVHVAGWAPTKRSLHAYAQMLGKLRLALSTAQPNWLFTSLILTARGLTTGTMPWRGLAVQATLDVFDSVVRLERSDGSSNEIRLLPARPVAAVYASFMQALAELEVACTITPAPQEVADTTPFDEDDRPADYDPAAVLRWFRAVTATAGVFEGWRSHFFGRTGIQIWWGAFDVALLLFSGKHVPPPADRGYLMKYDLDAELMNAGLYFGDEETAPYFYGYVYPEPPAAETLVMAPGAARWSPAIKEWVLPYDAVRAAADPAADLRAFLDAVYRQCTDAAGWDRRALSYDAPK